MEHRGLEQESWVSLADEAPAPVADDLVLDLREGTVIDLRGLDAPAWRAEPPLPELAPAADPNDVPLVGSRWVLLVALALLNALDLITTRAVLAAGGAEANPVMAPIIHHPYAPLLVKTAGIGVVALVVNCCPPDSKVVNRALALSVVAYAAIVSWNLVNLLVAGA
ncbi:MAG: hypothetical protein KDB35_19095 [Acidimicrobiales bacterium]|nr:hypothetical protein [Acidimicrobiales bacterium]MCB1015338.1 hypothetical protein [Acidimicrobiales bacterium]